MVKTSTFRRTFFNILKNGDIISTYLYQCLMGTEENRFLLVHTGEDEFIRAQTAFLYLEHYYHKKYSAQMLNSGFTSVFYRVLRDHMDNLDLEYRGRHDRHIIGVLHYVQANFFKVTLETTAKEFHYNSSYLSRMLKKSTGQSFTELVQMCRMNHACDLLCAQDAHYSVEQISEAVGYSTVEHFIRTFRRTYQMTPGEYRKAQQVK